MATQEERVRRNELLRESLTLYEQEECEVACAKYLMDFEGISDEQAARMESAGMLDDRRRPRLMRERIEPALRSKGRLTAEELAQRARAMADCKQLASHKGRALYRGFLLRGCGRQARVL